MNRQEAKSLLPIITAFAEGKEVESLSGTKWADTDNLSFESNYKYRIKPSPKYRPFANAEECWNEMLKHQPFGWVKATKHFRMITNVGEEELAFADNLSRESLKSAYEKFIFADGAVFGVMEEE